MDRATTFGKCRDRGGMTTVNIGILGGGSWAIALAVLLRGRGYAVRMWEYNEKDAIMLDKKREHSVKLPGIIIPENVMITNSIAKAIEIVRIDREALEVATSSYASFHPKPCGRR